MMLTQGLTDWGIVAIFVLEDIGMVLGGLQRRLNPVPFLLGLACAANIGSAETCCWDRLPI